MTAAITQQNLGLWMDWRKSGDEVPLNQLMTNLVPLVRSRIRGYQGNLPQSAVDAKAVVLARKALDTYDPTKGAISTHISNQVRPVSRLVYKSQNFTKIPESRLGFVTHAKRAIADLQDELGRHPSDAELADKMGVDIVTAGRLRREMVRDVVASGLQDPGRESAGTRSGDISYLLYHDLSGVDKTVFEELSGFNGRAPARSSEEVARRTGLSASQVRSARKRIEQTIEAMS